MGDNIKKTASGFALSSGAVLHDRYVIESVVGQGGFGIVYSAKDRQLDIKVAVKEFFVGRLAARGNDGITVEVKEGSKLFEEYRYRKLRFLNEARNLAKFSKHPNIVNVYDFFEENNTAYMVMEYLDGISMNSYMKQNGGKLDETSVLEIARSVAGALSSMHKEGIYHLDIAPDNIFLCSGSVIKLIDFGAAKFNEKEKGIKDVILKPGYSPPEQYIINGKVDERSDIYALAATMYRALTGTKPPEATNRKTIDTLVAPKKIVSEIKEPLNDAIVRALSVEPELRFASVKEFSEIDLSDNKKFESMTGGENGEVTFTETDSGDKANDSGIKQTETKNSKNTVLLIVVIVMILLIVIVIVFLILRYRSIKKSMDDKKIP